MLNRIHSMFRRPERGWDPVSEKHVIDYARSIWEKGVDDNLLIKLEDTLGGLAGKKVLDLGGGPGHYSVALAKRGADVTWYDISTQYRQLALSKAQENDVSIVFELGYLDESRSRLKNTYDLVFCNICFYYGWSDRFLAHVIYDLVSPGGVGYIDTNNTDWAKKGRKGLDSVKTALNSHLSLKIGHPFPPPGRLLHIFSGFPVERIEADYSSPGNDKVTFVKSRSAPWV